MSGNLPKHILFALKEREINNTLRTLKTNFPSIDFCSNDYLGFSKNNPILHTSNSNPSYGSTGSRLISGNSAFIEETEKQIADFHNAESALIFNSGYDANLGLLSSVPQKNDLILFDELCHASIYDGIRLSFAKHFKFKHNNIASLKELLQRHVANFENCYIAVESIYSMDGDEAPLLEILNLISNYKNCFLIVDEAHALGVFGKNGNGLCSLLNIEHKCFARVYTYGKALGAHGAAVVGNNYLRDYLINFARSFIYTTALPHHAIQQISFAYKQLEKIEKQNELRTNINYFIQNSSKLKNLIPSNSAIQCVVLGSNKAVDDMETKLAEQNIYVKAIKSPTVKTSTERVRICLHSFNTFNEIDLLINTLQKHY